MFESKIRNRKLIFSQNYCITVVAPGYLCLIPRKCSIYFEGCFLLMTEGTMHFSIQLLLTICETSLAPGLKQTIHSTCVSTQVSKTSRYPHWTNQSGGRMADYVLGETSMYRVNMWDLLPGMLNINVSPTWVYHFIVYKISSSNNWLKPKVTRLNP